MTDQEKETVVVTNSGSSAGLIVGIILAAAILFVGYLAYSGYFNQGETVSVELSVPEELTPSE